MKSFGLTDIGRVRKYNQDYSLECDEPIGNLENLYVVCDGLGGRNAGEYASKEAAENFFDYAEFSSQSEPLRILKEAVLKVNTYIFNEGRKPQYSGMATTLVGATAYNGTLYMVNVGDSRGYVINSSEISQITWDHSYVGELVRSEKITKDEARVHQQNNIITRAIGAENTVEPDFFQVELLRGDFILLCSDGLYNMLSERTIQKVVASKMSLKEKANKLIAMANQAGGKDNIAVLIIEY